MPHAGFEPAMLASDRRPYTEWLPSSVLVRLTRILLIFGNDGLPAEVCQSVYCLPWIEIYEHDPGTEREDTKCVMGMFRNKLYR